jgi:hypothetical protein
MLLLIDIFSINKGQGYENPSLEIIVTEHCSIGGCPLEEACEHCFLNQSDIFVVVLISFMCYCGDYAGYITVILPFLAFYFCSAYFLYLVYYKWYQSHQIWSHPPAEGIGTLKVMVLKVWEWEECSPSIFGGASEKGSSVGIFYLVQSDAKTDSRWVVSSCLTSCH